MENGHDIRFSFTSKQSTEFNKKFEAGQSEYVNFCGDEFVASARRLVLYVTLTGDDTSTLRIMEDGLIEERRICRDMDYESLMTMA